MINKLHNQNNQQPQKVQNSHKINSTTLNQRINAGTDFNSILRDVQNKNEVKISGHAMERLKERKIQLSNTDFENLNSAVSAIRNKGGKEALIFYKDVAFITSIKNNTIITAVDKDNLKENVFTNIDSAMII